MDVRECPDGRFVGRSCPDCTFECPNKNIFNLSNGRKAEIKVMPETAHQLGTPISSLEGWVEMLKESNTAVKIATEMGKDVERLKLVSDRFGKIGSTPQLVEENVIQQVEAMVAYIKRRAPNKVSFNVQKDAHEEVTAMINAPLFMPITRLFILHPITGRAMAMMIYFLYANNLMAAGHSRSTWVTQSILLTKKEHCLLRLMGKPLITPVTGRIPVAVLTSIALS